MSRFFQKSCGNPRGATDALHRWYVVSRGYRLRYAPQYASFKTDSFVKAILFALKRKGDFNIYNARGELRYGVERSLPDRHETVRKWVAKHPNWKDFWN